jgi:hypothetical protein
VRPRNPWRPTRWCASGASFVRPLDRGRGFAEKGAEPATAALPPVHTLP